jgi:hypothetical protein
MANNCRTWIDLHYCIFSYCAINIYLEYDQMFGTYLYVMYGEQTGEDGKIVSYGMD